MRADPDAVSALLTDPSEQALLLPAWLRLEVSDPEGLRRARLAGTPATFTARLRTVGGVSPWTVEVLDGDGRGRYTERVHGAWFSPWLHRHRLERAIGGRVRAVDEVVLAPTGRPGRLWVGLAERVLRHVHRGLAARLAQGDDVRTGARVYRLEVGNAAHAEAALSHVPGT